MDLSATLYVVYRVCLSSLFVVVERVGCWRILTFPPKESNPILPQASSASHRIHLFTTPRKKESWPFLFFGSGRFMNLGAGPFDTILSGRNHRVSHLLGRCSGRLLHLLDRSSCRLLEMLGWFPSRKRPDMAVPNGSLVGYRRWGPLRRTLNGCHTLLDTFMNICSYRLDLFGKRLDDCKLSFGC